MSPGFFTSHLGPDQGAEAVRWGVVFQGDIADVDWKFKLYLFILPIQLLSKPFITRFFPMNTSNLKAEPLSHNKQKLACYTGQSNQNHVTTVA